MREWTRSDGIELGYVRPAIILISYLKLLVSAEPTSAVLVLLFGLTRSSWIRIRPGGPNNPGTRSFSLVGVSPTLVCSRSDKIVGVKSTNSNYFDSVLGLRDTGCRSARQVVE